MSPFDGKAQKKRFFTAGVCGFCHGVRRAISIFEQACSEHKSKIYVLHELVHNTFVSRNMLLCGAVFVDSIDDIPAGAVAMIGAHGVSPQLEKLMRERFTVIDSTCPRVKTLQTMAENVKPDEELIMLCKKGHPEAVGVLGYSGTEKIYPVLDVQDAANLPELKNAVLLSQTTMSGAFVRDMHELLKKRFPELEFIGNICDASSKRQSSVEKLAENCRCVLVVGSPHSSNAAELVGVAERCGVAAYLVENGNAVTSDMLAGADTVGVTAGASTPDELIDDVKKRLSALGYSDGDVCNG